MQLKKEELNKKNGYRLLKTLKHDELVDFVKQYFHTEKSIITRGSNVMLVLVLAVILMIAKVQGMSFLKTSMYFGIGALITFAFIPFHEMLHGLAYYYFGATDIRYHKSLKKFVFYAVAHQFVISRFQFVTVALVPFFALNTLALIAGWIWPQYIVIGLFIIFINIMMCSGDFALLNYYWKNKDKEIFTYDDDAISESYFYEKIR